MDQEIDTPRVARVLRLALATLGVAAGFLLLSTVFGGSSASAATGDDDPALATGSPAAALVVRIVDSVAEPLAAPLGHAVAPAAQQAQDAARTVAHAAPAAAVTTPVAAIADDSVIAVASTVLGPEVAGDALGAGPMSALLVPLAGVVDDALAGATGTIVLLTSPVVLANDAAPAVPPAVTSPAATAGAALAGVANGLLGDGTAGPGDSPAAGIGGGGNPIPIALLGAGLIALLAVRRGLRPDPAAPGSPVFDTDSSPD